MSVSIAQLALHLMNGIGGKTARLLIAHCGSAENVFAQHRHLDKIQGIGKIMLTNFAQQKQQALELAEKELEQCAKSHIEIIFYTDTQRYPTRLREIPDAPLLFYQKGDFHLQHQRQISIVGTRQASTYGKDFLAELLQELREFKPMIISGLAYGIDITAHKEALKNNLPTVGVLANGLNTVYPSAHQVYVNQMLEKNGGVISEFALNTKPDAPRFPARNRITAGLADAVIVIESMKKGGAMLTATYANDYHREVFALPGDIRRLSSEGCNYLIRTNQAQLISSAQDLIDLLNWTSENQVAKKPKMIQIDALNLNENEKKVVLLLLEKESFGMDDMCVMLNISLNQMAVVLLNLEMNDIIEALPGKYFRLKQKLYK